MSIQLLPIWNRSVSASMKLQYVYLPSLGFLARGLAKAQLTFVMMRTLTGAQRQNREFETSLFCPDKAVSRKGLTV